MGASSSFPKSFVQASSFSGMLFILLILIAPAGATPRVRCFFVLMIVRRPSSGRAGTARALGVAVARQ